MKSSLTREGPRSIALGCVAFAAALLLAACGGDKGSGSGVGSQSVADAGGGTPDTGGADAGSSDAGAVDAGGVDGGALDGGATDGGATDGGTADGGSLDGGSADGGPAGDGGVVLGGPGPWPVANASYGAADGIQESPVVAMSTDEAQNRWVATPSAVYVLQPGAATFRRFGSREGLHLADHPALYDETSYCATGPNPPNPPLPGTGGGKSVPGAAAGQGILTIVGGGPGEVFVGYRGVDPVNGDCTDPASDRHSGKLDRLRLLPDGSAEVKRFDFFSTGYGMLYWHNRTVYRMVYDHVHHPHTLYAGTEHGVNMFFPDRYRDPLPGEWPDTSMQEYTSDHMHVQVCYHGDATCLAGGEGNARMGDWRGLWIDPKDGDLWHAGRWSGGKIRFDPDLKVWNHRSGVQAYSEAFGNGSDPIFPVAAVGDVVSLSAVTVAKDGTAWFASSWFYGNGASVPGPGQGRGIAHYLGKGKFEYFSPTADAGMAQGDVQDMVALPDGRLVLAGASSGLTFWNPATKASTHVRAGQGIPDDRVLQLELDTMVDPPALHVATAGGAAVLRTFP